MIKSLLPLPWQRNMTIINSAPTSNSMSKEIRFVQMPCYTYIHFIPVHPFLPLLWTFVKPISMWNRDMLEICSFGWKSPIPDKSHSIEWHRFLIERHILGFRSAEWILNLPDSEWLVEFKAWYKCWSMLPWKCLGCLVNRPTASHATY